LYRLDGAGGVLPLVGFSFTSAVFVLERSGGCGNWTTSSSFRTHRKIVSALERQSILSCQMILSRIQYEGRTVKIERLSDQQVYLVPDEIPDGARVKIVGVDIGIFIVEHNGAKFRISLACLDHSSYDPPL
jgi:hypothetical protein